jgi:nuclear pore complex protein Nup188
MVSLRTDTCGKSCSHTRCRQVHGSIHCLFSPDSLGFELQIFRQLKLLNSLLSLRPSLQTPIFALLKTVLTAAQPDNREQPSILAHLGGDEKLHIPLVIELATDPFADPETRIAVWRYASGVMASQQQGLAILLLFGAETGRKTANKPAVVEDKEEKETLLRKAVTKIVDDDLKMTKIIERQVFGTTSQDQLTNVDAIMEFLSKAHNSWAPILSTLRQDKALWAKLLILLAWSGIIVDTSDSPEQTLEKCWHLHTAAAAVDAIAVEIFHAGSVAQAASIEVLNDHFVTKKDVKLQDIASEAFRIRGYRDSLFFHLRRNFQIKFPTADILRFQRNPIRERQFGEEYFFDITIGRAVLGRDPSWVGFEKEIRLANLNMSIVDAQLVCFVTTQLTFRNYLVRGSI